jgi:hypothetical protein
MNAKIEVELFSSPTPLEWQQMYAAARSLTDDANSIVISAPTDKPRTITAEFTILRSRQIDVVDIIANEFRHRVREYNQTTISFPKNRAIEPLSNESRNIRHLLSLDEPPKLK